MKKTIMSIDGEDLIVEKDRGEYFFWFGKLCLIKTDKRLEDKDLIWLLRSKYTRKVAKEINEKIEKAEVD